ncbi:MAG: M81 family metallopeptidase [Oscillospiraceae bacterium]|nr:M81 family metallopeptidase [Oscillospiraceae bacterium]
MKYIYAASFLHESNTYSSHISDLDWFQKRCWKLGDAVLDRFRGVRTEFGGFIDGLAEYRDIALIPVLAAEATPSGPVASEVAGQVRKMLCTALSGAPQVDGVLLSLHGAMVTQDSEDGEGDLAEAIRAVVGPEVPVYATLDLHANVTEKMIRNIDVMIPYDRYPHTDKYERGLQTAHLLARAVRNECHPVMAVKKLPLLMPLVGSETEAMKPVRTLIEHYEEQPGVFNVSITHGFISADIRQAGAAVQVVANDLEKAKAIADAVALQLWQQRAQFASQYYDLEELEQILSRNGKGLLVISDGPDNPGGGGYGDDTRVLRKLLEIGCKDAVVALIYDPGCVERCEKAGEGNLVSLELGGKFSHTQPLACQARVLKLTDGKYRNLGPMNPGLQMDLLGTALIEINGIRVILVRNPTQPYDFALMHLHGIDPRKERRIVLKSAVHFRGAYEKMAEKIVLLTYPGICILSPQEKLIRRCNRPIYPLDKDVTYDGCI